MHKGIGSQQVIEWIQTGCMKPSNMKVLRLVIEHSQIYLNQSTNNKYGNNSCTKFTLLLGQFGVAARRNNFCQLSTLSPSCQITMQKIWVLMDTRLKLSNDNTICSAPNHESIPCWSFLPIYCFLAPYLVLCWNFAIVLFSLISAYHYQSQYFDLYSNLADMKIVVGLAFLLPNSFSSRISELYPSQESSAKDTAQIKIYSSQNEEPQLQHWSIELYEQTTKVLGESTIQVETRLCESATDCQPNSLCVNRQCTLFFNNFSPTYLIFPDLGVSQQQFEKLIN